GQPGIRPPPRDASLPPRGERLVPPLSAAGGAQALPGVGARGAAPPWPRLRPEAWGAATGKLIEDDRLGPADGQVQAIGAPGQRVQLDESGPQAEERLITAGVPEP